jgi:hypothetical protein
MADRLYWSANQNLVLYNHPERLRGTYQEDNGAVPSGSWYYYYAEYYVYPSAAVVDKRIWGATLFTDGSASGGAAGGLKAVKVPTIVRVVDPAGPLQGPTDTYWLVDE